MLKEVDGDLGFYWQEKQIKKTEIFNQKSIYFLRKFHDNYDNWVQKEYIFKFRVCLNKK